MATVKDVAENLEGVVEFLEKQTQHDWVILVESDLRLAAAVLGGSSDTPVDPPIDPPVDPPVDPPTGNDPQWDARLDTTGTYVEKRSGAGLEVVACWKTENGSWEPGAVPDWARAWQNNHLGGDHHIYMRAEDANGNPLPGVHFAVLWNAPHYDQGDELTYDVNHQEGWADFVMGPQNTPANAPGEVGYLAFAFIPGGAGGWKVHRLFMPSNHHHSYFIVWRMKQAQAAIFPASAMGHWILGGAAGSSVAETIMTAQLVSVDYEPHFPFPIKEKATEEMVS